MILRIASDVTQKTNFDYLTTQGDAVFKAKNKSGILELVQKYRHSDIENVTDSVNTPASNGTNKNTSRNTLNSEGEKPNN